MIRTGTALGIASILFLALASPLASAEGGVQAALDELAPAHPMTGNAEDCCPGNGWMKDAIDECCPGNGWLLEAVF